MLFFREFRPIDSQQSSSHLFHPSTEEILLGGGVSACGLWLVLFWFVVGLSVSFSPPSDCISLPSMMTWGTMPTRRPYSWKKKGSLSHTRHSGAWRLLHAVSNAGGSRFTVGSAVRYPPGKSDATNKARHLAIHLAQEVGIPQHPHNGHAVHTGLFEPSSLFNRPILKWHAATEPTTSSGEGTFGSRSKDATRNKGRRY